MRNQQPVYIRQTGAALIISLVLLTMLTTLGVTAMRSNLLDVRMHNNASSKLVALQCAEAGLLAGENWILQTTSMPGSPSSGAPAAGQVWSLGDDELAGLSAQDASWWAANGNPVGSLTTGNFAIGCSQTPYYIIETYGPEGSMGSDDTESDLGYEALANFSGRPIYFRITAYGVGALGTAPVVLQSTFAQPYN